MTMTTVVFRGVAPVAVAAALVAGCGGGDGGVSSGDFIAEADAICADANEQRATHQTPGIRTSGRGQDEAVAEYAGKMDPVYSQALTELRALAPPPGDEATIREMLDTFGAAFALIDKTREAAQANDRAKGEEAYFGWSDLALDGQNRAHSYGLEDCALFGTP
ncbi:MAG TPA: hypothetical protein VI409_13600 [Gaiellaceae bacterium]|nr:hypothetical protein [Gaiellaceae bacterium]